MTATVVAAVAFSPEWLPDSVALPVRVPRSRVTQAWKRANGREDVQGARDQHAGASMGSAADSAMVHSH